MASSCGTRWSGMGRPEGIKAVLPAHNERQRRLAIGTEALPLGHGGIRLVAAAAGVQEGTVSRKTAELDFGRAVLGRVRRPGGGRKKAVDLDPGLRPALLSMVEPDERGDPMSPLRWTTKSTWKLATELTRQGHRVSADTVAGLLRRKVSVSRPMPRPTRVLSNRTGTPRSSTSPSRHETTGAPVTW